MAFKPRNDQPDLSGLLITLQQSKLIQTNPALYQTLKELIQRVGAARSGLLEDIDILAEEVASIVINNTVLADKTYLTATDETADLPNSRELLAGTNITFDDSTPGERTINASGGVASDYVVLSDGGTPALPIDDGFGSFIYIPYTP